jgi:hypothetical protein
MIAYAWRWVALAVCVGLLAACSARFEWRELRTDEFVASLPGRPQTVARDIELAGEKVPMTMWSTGVGPTMFAVGAARLPAAAVADQSSRDRTLAYFRDGLVRNIGGTLTSQKPAPLSLSPGSARRVLVAEAVEAAGNAGPDGRKSRLAARFFIVDDQFFQIVALGAEGEIPPEVLDTFFTSFRLTRS